VYLRGGIYWLKYVVDGKTYQQSSGSRIRADAERILRSRLDVPVDRSVTINDVLDKLHIDYELRGHGTKMLRDHLVHVREYFGKMKAADATEDMITRY